MVLLCCSGTTCSTASVAVRLAFFCLLPIQHLKCTGDLYRHMCLSIALGEMHAWLLTMSRMRLGFLFDSKHTQWKQS